MEELFTYVSGGADAATFAILFFLYKLDRRLLKCEIKLGITE